MHIWKHGITILFGDHSMLWLICCKKLTVSSKLRLGFKKAEWRIVKARKEKIRKEKTFLLLKLLTLFRKTDKK